MKSTIKDNETKSQVIFDVVEPSNFTMIPNILLDIGLDPYEIRAYIELRSKANEKGESWWSNKKLAERCCMSVSKFKLVKRSLALPRVVLKDRALISIFARETNQGDCDTDLIKINYIWDINEIHFSKKGQSPHDQGVGHQKTEGGSPGDHKQDQGNHIHENKQTEEPEAVVCSLEDREKIEEMLKPYGFNRKSLAELTLLPILQVNEGLDAYKEWCKDNKPDSIQASVRAAIQGTKNSKPWKMNISKEKKESDLNDAHNKIIESNKSIALQLISSYESHFNEKFRVKLFSNYVDIKLGKTSHPLGYLEDSFVATLKYCLNEGIHNYVSSM